MVYFYKYINILIHNNNIASIYVNCWVIFLFDRNNSNRMVHVGKIDLQEKVSSAIGQLS